MSFPHALFKLLNIWLKCVFVSSDRSSLSSSISLQLKTQLVKPPLRSKMMIHGQINKKALLYLLTDI